MPITFLVESKDLLDKKKNPNLSLSVKDILANPKIPISIIDIKAFEQ